MLTRHRLHPAAVLAILLTAGMVRGEELAFVTDVAHQPVSAQVRRVAEALSFIGQPLPDEMRARLDQALDDRDESRGVRRIQEVLDPLCLVGVTINPESRVKAQPGPADPTLIQHGWRGFLVKVQNEAGVTSPLRVSSPNAKPVQKPSSSRAEPDPPISEAEVRSRWADVAMFDDRPLTKRLSGLGLEYRIVLVSGRDAGSREARLGFDVGQGTQDLGFRADVDILFQIRPAVTVTFEVKDQDGDPTMASFLIRDGLGRVYPSQGRRLAPDFFFHPQIYRQDGETVLLPPGTFQVEWTRGPEYLTLRREITVPESATHRETFHLKRWANLAERGWYSGDHHVHAAGCAHYESPSEGVTPADMMRHIRGEDLDVGCVLSWGPCWYFQKQFFEGKLHALSTSENLMRYDVEVSGFPSSHCGHLCLLRLKEDDYPATTRIEEWPSWDLPVLKWGQSQGGVVGFSHSGWGLQTKSLKLPNLEIPPFDGIGANEYIVDVTHDAVDFISTVDTPAPFELNIWYHTLNAGYRARISGETDFPCIYGERVGLGRVYVDLGKEPLDFDRWCQGLKEGRSYVSDGRSHLVDFTVGGVKLGQDGSELRLDKPGDVTVTLDAGAFLDPEPSDEAKAIRARPLDQKPYWDLERSRIKNSRKVLVEIVVNGQAVDRQEIEADGAFRDLSFRVPIANSSWVAARVYPSSHTNPVFVTVAGKPIRASKASAQWCLDSVDQCWTQKQRLIRPEERDAARAAFDHARAAYRAILAESKDD